MQNLLLFCTLSLIVLLGCHGKDRLPTDVTPPSKPIIIQHLGDMPDTTSYYNNQISILTDENNGIDTVPDEDWIRICWKHLLDTDLDYIRVFRFDEVYNEIVQIDSISYNNDFFVDDTDSLYTNRKYSYYIEVIDQSGNSAVSDTVSYKLLSKQILTSPDYGAIADPSDITFEWQKSGFVSKFRLLLFDDNHELVWFRDVNVAFEPDYFTVDVPTNLLSSYPSDHIYWRVDAFDWDYEMNIFIGSESEERLLYLVDRK